MGQPKSPLDPFPYPLDPRSRPIALGIEDGLYVYVQDIDGVIHVLPDGGHLHPRVLGNAQPALYAGDLRITGMSIMDVTNCSGSFQFDEPEGLLQVSTQLEALGFEIREGAVRYFPLDGSTPTILR
jgi:hypothetical protein